jgi:hypothetical protein
MAWEDDGLRFLNNIHRYICVKIRRALPMLGCDSRIGHLHDCHCSSDPTSLVANGPFDRNACIAIDVSRYFMHRRICQTPCQTQELVLAHCQLGKVTLLAK